MYPDISELFGKGWTLGSRGGPQTPHAMQAWGQKAVIFMGNDCETLLERTQVDEHSGTCQ